MVAIKNVTRVLCTTPACLKLANHYLSNLAPNYKDLDPCTNFEEMVCGGFRMNHTIPPSKQWLDTLDIMGDENKEQQRALLEGPYPGESSHSHFSPRNLHPRDLSVDQQNFETLQRAYNACMDETTRKALGVTPITDLVKDIAKTFDRNDWSETMRFAQRVGAETLAQFYIDSDFDDPTQQTVQMSSGAGLSLPGARYYENATMLTNQFAPVVADILKAILGNGSTTANFTDQARQIVDFEKALASINPPENDSYFLTNMKMSIPQADDLAPALGLPAIISSFAPSNVSISTLPIYAPKLYLASLTTLLSTTPNTTIASYFTFRTILSVRTLVLTDIFTPYLTLRNRVRGIKTDPQPPPLWETCISTIRNDLSLGWLLSRFFIESHFSSLSFTTSNLIINDVRAAYITRLQSTPWLDETTRAKAIEKINLMIQSIGYPTSNPNITSPASLREYYTNLTITNVHFTNCLSASEWGTVRLFSRLGRPTEREIWEIYPVTVNAYYSPSQNKIVFPAAILQPPVFGVEFPSAVNYGAFGAVAGHEVSHAFDKTGSEFDGTGKVVDWWSGEVKGEYMKREKCFVEQFGNVTTWPNDEGSKGKEGSGYKIDANKTLGENEADSAGIVAAWDAWQLRRGVEEDVGLPGLEGWTEEQLFFLAYGTFWCGLLSEDGLKLRLGDEHSPNEVRISQTTANSRAFREAFGCKVREPVCELW